MKIEVKTSWLSALILLALAAAAIVTAQAGGDLAGTLISTVPAQPAATVQAQRRILLD